MMTAWESSKAVHACGFWMLQRAKSSALARAELSAPNHHSSRNAAYDALQRRACKPLMATGSLVHNACALQSCVAAKLQSCVGLWSSLHEQHECPELPRPALGPCV